ncbi:hypothetical protein [Desulfitobacterium hafniense]|uniref:hypothetical protein n=1 Tax=Desulfitobacterium hafniense TaxID=49338 RepID=UPI0003773E0A|nr:hypothetical protein [Desulfitobacterium hafniense]
MRRLYFIFFVLLTMLITLGCGSTSSTNKSITLQEVIEKSKLVTEGYYEYEGALSTLIEIKPDITYLYRVWFKNQQARIEIETIERGVPISVSGKVYSEEEGLIEEYNIIKESSYNNIGQVGENVPVKVRELTFLKYIDDLDSGKAKINSIEMVNNEECIVVESGTSGLKKMWISVQTGTPTQVQYDNDDIIRYKNVRIGKNSIKDKDLAVPEQKD